MILNFLEGIDNNLLENEEKLKNFVDLYSV